MQNPGNPSEWRPPFPPRCPRPMGPLGGQGTSGEPRREIGGFDIRPQFPNTTGNFGPRPRWPDAGTMWHTDGIPNPLAAGWDYAQRPPMPDSNPHPPGLAPHWNNGQYQRPQMPPAHAGSWSNNLPYPQANFASPPPPLPPPLHPAPSYGWNGQLPRVESAWDSYDANRSSTGPTPGHSDRNRNVENRRRNERSERPERRHRSSDRSRGERVERRRSRSRERSRRRSRSQDRRSARRSWSRDRADRGPKNRRSRDSSRSRDRESVSSVGSSRAGGKNSHGRNWNGRRQPSERRAADSRSTGDAAGGFGERSEGSARKRDPSERAPTPSTSSQNRKAGESSSETPEEQHGSNEIDEEMEDEASMWTRCSPADLYFQRSLKNPAVVLGTPKLEALLDRFSYELVERASRARSLKPVYGPPPRKANLCIPKTTGSNESSDSEETTDEESSGEEDTTIIELEHKKNHPDRLHEELWYNDPGEMNDGPVCKCSMKARRSGIRHGIYCGEEHLEPCDPNSNNADRLYHYRMMMSPYTNFVLNDPTVIMHDGHEFIFEGFSLFSHYPLETLPTCRVIRFNIQYSIHYVEEQYPTNFTIRGAELLSDYLLREILELVDLDLRAHGDTEGCKRFHFYPRFARALEDNGKEILSMNEVISYLMSSSKPLVDEADLPMLMARSQHEWQNFADQVKGMIVTHPSKKPSSLRVDQLDRDMTNSDPVKFPEIIHFGIRPLQLSYAGNPTYQKAWRDYVKFRHLLANKPKIMYPDRHKLMQKEMRLQELRTKKNLKRDVTVVVSSKGFFRTGIMCDVIQHAMLLPVLVCHLRFHKALSVLEDKIGHKFRDRFLLQLAFTHPSFRENYGTNPDHARNSLTNCGIRQPEYGDRKIHYLHTRKRGITTLINIMSRFGKMEETRSRIIHNERLEFLGDAVVEFLSSIHLFHLFPEIEEGGLATYRAALVQNQHLAVMAQRLELDKYMLYAHGSDLCHDLVLRHAMANCFEALMGALFLDSGVEVVDKVFSAALFQDSPNADELLDIWVNYPPHPIQEQEPDGDRQWIEYVPLLKKLTKFEDEIGVEFKHIRLLARAFTHRSVGYNNLTLGSNQRLEFLGDTILQLVASEHLFKFFPEHHEGHLSLLRSSLVNNRTQAVVCSDLGMVNYALYAYPKDELRTKDRADLLEAVLGALYVDKGVDFCRTFCQVCFFPRLQRFIMYQDWNDPKSKLQQCCLTLRTMDGGEPDIPIYKVIECKGPTNTRTFTVAVYFRGERLAQGKGHSIQQAEMEAANTVLHSSKAVTMFPQLTYQNSVIRRSIKQMWAMQYRYNKAKEAEEASGFRTA